MGATLLYVGLRELGNRDSSVERVLLEELTSYADRTNDDPRYVLWCIRESNLDHTALQMASKRQTWYVLDSTACRHRGAAIVSDFMIAILFTFGAIAT